jgi:hypothetical protein
MLFPDISPSREECIAAVAAALQAEGGRIYVDASVLIHCYEMNAAASEDLLSALERYDPRVGVPVWAANETWEYVAGANRIPRFPLRASARRVQNELSRFRRESTRYIDDDALKDALTTAEFQQKLDAAIGATVDLVKQVENHEPKADITTARLLPFITTHRTPSDIAAILDVVTRTANARVAHRMPPGFADTSPAPEEGEEEKPAPRKGKTKNPHGDLIIWLEILEDCCRHKAEQLVLITRDTTKDDWVYVPRKIRDEKGRLQDNGGQITLPLPLLVQEATQKCPSVQGVHIVSVEMLAQVLRSMRVDVSNLTAALQSGDDLDNDVPDGDLPDQGRMGPEGPYEARFESGDMAYEPEDGSEIDRLIGELNGDGWKVQNQAVRGLEPLLSAASREQRVQVGRGLVAAANDGALEPGEFLARVLAADGLGRALRSDLLIGALAEVYVAETGEPKKPTASRSVVEALYAHQSDPELSDAYAAVLSRLAAQARKYLALPTESARSIKLDIALEKDTLRGVTAGEVSLLEEDAPSNRAVQRTGRDTVMTTEELLGLLAEEFVVPLGVLTTDLLPSASFNAPELIGFVSWGPHTGTLLR